MCGPEAELPGSLSRSLSRYSYSGGRQGVAGGSSTIQYLSILPLATPKNKKVFGLGGGIEAQYLETRRSQETQAPMTAGSLSEGLAGRIPRTRILNLNTGTAARIRSQELGKKTPSSAGPKGEVFASKDTLAGEI